MRPNQTRSRILTAAEVADYLHLPLRTVYEYARTGRLPAFRVGRRLLRFDRHDVDQWIEQYKATARRKGNGSKSRDPDPIIL